MQRLDPIYQRLLDEFQRDLPLEPRPFLAMAQSLALTEDEVIERLGILQKAGMISRIGATIRPNTAGCSTLAALAVPPERIEAVAAIVGEEPGVNHSYLREDQWNLWFVATAPTADLLSACLRRITRRSGLTVLDLPLVRPFNIDLGFRLSGPRATLNGTGKVDASAILDGDRPLLQMMASGLPLTARPFAAVGQHLGRSESDVLDRLKHLLSAGILTRVGVIVRHRALGWNANAMVVWQLPESRIEAAGLALAGLPGVTLCYQRRIVPGIWPFALFCMIHAKSRPEAMSVLATAAARPELQGASYRSLFSTRCFKQRGALVHSEEVAA